MKTLFYTFTLMIFAISASASNPIYNHNGQAIHYKHSTNTMIDQDRCQAEANHMAANNIAGHVWGVIGNFEGVGYGNSPNCQTCTPNSNMKITGDASALGRNGKWYRVRSWRY
jgi:hypothetical protein